MKKFITVILLLMPLFCFVQGAVKATPEDNVSIVRENQGILYATGGIDNVQLEGEIDWTKTDPLALINILKERKEGWVTVGEAPKGWIQKEHVKELMKLIDSTEPSAPVVAVVSSYLPFKEKSTVGNEAMFLIEGFREGRYPPGICSVYGFKGDPNEYAQWWDTVKYELSSRRKHSYKPALGYVPDKEAAVKIAEAVLVPIYGKDVIEKEKPLNAYLADGIWIVNGTLHTQLGGVAVIEISREDGKILRVSHGE